MKTKKKLKPQVGELRRRRGGDGDQSRLPLLDPGPFPGGPGCAGGRDEEGEGAIKLSLTKNAQWNKSRTNPSMLRRQTLLLAGVSA